MRVNQHQEKYSRNVAPQSAASTLIVAAHPDDEIIGAGGWLYKQPGELAVAFLTDGAPRNPRYWAPGYTNTDDYRRQRRREAIAVWQHHRPGTRLFFGSTADQDLAFALEPAAAWLDQVIAQAQPELILVPAFEAGHPDHDAANFLVAQATCGTSMNVWEYALYTVWNGEVRRQFFPAEPAARIESPLVLQRKQVALAGYASQHAVLQEFDPAIEAMRLLPEHNYRKPARAELGVYELWGWPWRQEQVAAQFCSHMQGRRPLCAC